MNKKKRGLPYFYFKDRLLLSLFIKTVIYMIQICLMNHLKAHDFLYLVIQENYPSDLH